LAEAARRYGEGYSLADIGSRIGADAATIKMELRRAGVEIRPRRGWKQPQA
jgi:hypothetical protein